MAKNINVALIGQAFMGRAHSNAYRQVGRYFDLPVQPVMKTIAGRNAATLCGFSEAQGWQGCTTRWQDIAVEGYGVLDGSLRGGCSTYAEYFLLNLDRHLGFLEDGGFLTAAEQTESAVEIQHHQALLAIDRGCLVHKDLALWNVLGTPHEILAFVDFDDSISGDPLDDLSLLACFHDTAFLKAALAGYTSLRPLPSDHLRRFWLHLLRNMIVKAVIRAGAGLFERDDGYFLIGNGSSGSVLRQFTQQRLRLSLHGLREEMGIDDL